MDELSLAALSRRRPRALPCPRGGNQGAESFSGAANAMPGRARLPCGLLPAAGARSRLVPRGFAATHGASLALRVSGHGERRREPLTPNGLQSRPRGGRPASHFLYVCASAPVPARPAAAPPPTAPAPAASAASLAPTLRCSARRRDGAHDRCRRPVRLTRARWRQRDSTSPALDFRALLVNRLLAAGLLPCSAIRRDVPVLYFQRLPGISP